MVSFTTYLNDANMQNNIPTENSETEKCKK